MFDEKTAGAEEKKELSRLAEDWRVQFNEDAAWNTWLAGGAGGGG